MKFLRDDAKLRARELEAIILFTYREITGHALARYATHLMSEGVKEATPKPVILSLLTNSEECRASEIEVRSTARQGGRDAK